MPKQRTIMVKDYDPVWKDEFEKLKSQISSVLDDVEVEIMHIGSTSIEGLAAKPIIDMLIIGTIQDFEKIKNSLGHLGYSHNGDQGITGREAFKLPEELKSEYFAHHLYFCDYNARPLTEYKAFLRHLRNNPETVNKYGEIKKEAARLYPHDINRYMDHKGPFIAEIMTQILTENNLEPENPDKRCVHCESSEITSKYQMKYLENGYKVEIFSNTCEDCGKSWEREVSRV